VEKMLNNGIKLNEADCHLNLRVANNGYSANTLNTQTFKDLDLLWFVSEFNSLNIRFFS